MAQIYIYSEPIHAGKTTRLNEWIANLPSVDGILAPVINGKRYIKYISSGDLYLLEADSDNPESFQQIGKYQFRTSVFQKAQNYLLNLIDNTPDWIIVDEIGFLELEGLGYEPAVSQIINSLQIKSNVNILLVIRDTLKDKVIDYYKLSSNAWIDFNPDKQY